MSKSIYVGNLPWSTTEEQVQELFSAYGSVSSVKLISDRETGRARGFGFVEMEDAGALEAIQALDNHEFGGRTLRGNEAKPRAPSPPRDWASQHNGPPARRGQGSVHQPPGFGPGDFLSALEPARKTGPSDAADGPVRYDLCPSLTGTGAWWLRNSTKIIHALHHEHFALREDTEGRM